MQLDHRALPVLPREIRNSRPIRRIRRQLKTLFAAGEPRLKRYLRPALEILEVARVRGQTVLLEGTQGTGSSLFLVIIHTSHPATLQLGLPG